MSEIGRIILSRMLSLHQSACLVKYLSVIEREREREITLMLSNLSTAVVVLALHGAPPLSFLTELDPRHRFLYTRSLKHREPAR